MKKYLPAIIFVMIFTGFLSIQIGRDLLSRFNDENADKKMALFYEDLIKHTNVLTLDKNKIALQDIKSPLVIVTFWASWCLPCLEELQSLVELSKRIKSDQLTIVAINSDEKDQLANINRIQKLYGLDFVMVADTNNDLTSKFLVSALPFSLIIKNGTIVEIVRGAKDYASVETIDKLNGLLSNP